MSLRRPAYATRYGYSWLDAIRAEFWWRVEHTRAGRGGGAYARRKAAERRGYDRVLAAQTKRRTAARSGR